MRGESEWVETVDAGWNRLVGADAKEILMQVQSFAPNGSPSALWQQACGGEVCASLLG